MAERGYVDKFRILWIDEDRAYLQRIASPQVKLDFWEGVGHGMKAAKPAEYNEALESWLLG